MELDQRLRKAERIPRPADFSRAMRGRCSASDGLLVVYVCKNGLPWSRLGISTSRKVGNAVLRNRVRRRLRAVFRRRKAELPSGVDIVCIARPGAAGDEVDLQGSFLRQARRAVARLESNDAHRR